MRSVCFLWLLPLLAGLCSGFVAPLQSSQQQLPSAVTLSKDPLSPRSQLTFAIFKRAGAPSAAPASKAVASKAAASKAVAGGAVGRLSSWCRLLWQFGRPHTMLGTAAAALAVPVFAASAEARQSAELGYTILHGLVPGLLTNLFITGINQVTDVSIDRVNKPHLPVATGRLTQKSAALISGAALLGALAMVFRRSPYTSTPLKLTVVLPALLGAMYSLPPFRLKKHPLLALLAILAVRGPIVNMGYFAHTKAVMEGYKPTSVSKLLKDFPSVLPLATFYTLFAAVIALMKDIPDIKGDKLHHILSYSVKLGPQKVFDTTTSALTTMLSVVATALIGSTNMAAPMTRRDQLQRLGLGVLAALTVSDINARRHKVDPERPDQVYGFYMYLWRLFQGSYLLLPSLSSA